MIDINDFKELKEKIEVKQHIKLKDFENTHSKNVFHTRQADEKDGIHFRFVIEKDTLRISQFYLVYEKRGTGSDVFNWIENYCLKNGIKKFKVTNVKEDKIGMQKLCKNFKMSKSSKIESEGDWYYNYEKELI